MSHCACMISAGLDGEGAELWYHMLLSWFSEGRMRLGSECVWVCVCMWERKKTGSGGSNVYIFLLAYFYIAFIPLNLHVFDDDNASPLTLQFTMWLVACEMSTCLMPFSDIYDIYIFLKLYIYILTTYILVVCWKTCIHIADTFWVDIKVYWIIWTHCQVVPLYGCIVMK